MSTPEDFELGIPRTFDALLQGDGLTRGAKHPEGVWIAVRGGELPVPIVVRIDQASNGRFIITGMLIGLDERREVTWTTLRKIKPASVLSMIFAGWDPHDPERLSREALFERELLPWETAAQEEADAAGGWAYLDPAQPPDDMSTEDAAFLAQRDRDERRSLLAYELWRLTKDATPNHAAAEEVTRPRASVATNLTEFASAYRRNVATNPRRATTATAQQLHISRATAIRRIAECREAGLLPPQEQR